MLSMDATNVSTNLDVNFMDHGFYTLKYLNSYIIIIIIIIISIIVNNNNIIIIIMLLLFLTPL